MPTPLSRENNLTRTHLLSYTKVKWKNNRCRTVRLDDYNSIRIILTMITTLYKTLCHSFSHGPHLLHSCIWFVFSFNTVSRHRIGQKQFKTMVGHLHQHNCRWLYASGSDGGDIWVKRLIKISIKIFVQLLGITLHRCNWVELCKQVWGSRIIDWHALLSLQWLQEEKA